MTPSPHEKWPSKVARLLHEVRSRIRSTRQKEDETEEKVFQIIHQPDRLRVPATDAEIPSDQECLEFIMAMKYKKEERRGDSHRRADGTALRGQDSGNDLTKLRRKAGLEYLRDTTDEAGDSPTVNVPSHNSPRSYFEEDERSMKYERPLAAPSTKQNKNTACNRQDKHDRAVLERASSPAEIPEEHRWRTMPHDRPVDSHNEQLRRKHRDLENVHQDPREQTDRPQGLSREQLARYPSASSVEANDGDVINEDDPLAEQFAAVNQEAAEMGNAAAFMRIPSHCRLCGNVGAGRLGGLCKYCEAKYMRPAVDISRGLMLSPIAAASLAASARPKDSVSRRLPESRTPTLSGNLSSPEPVLARQVTSGASALQPQQAHVASCVVANKTEQPVQRIRRKAVGSGTKKLPHAMRPMNEVTKAPSRKVGLRGESLATKDDISSFQRWQTKDQRESFVRKEELYGNWSDYYADQENYPGEGTALKTTRGPVEPTDPKRDTKFYQPIHDYIDAVEGKNRPVRSRDVVSKEDQASRGNWI